MWSEKFRGAVKRSVNFVLPPVWGSLLGGVRPRHEMSDWSSPGGQQVLIVAPHPDDEVAGCGGTLLRHVAAGDRVTVAVITDGRRSASMPDAAAMARARHREAERVARLLGVRLAWLGLHEGDWQDSDFALRFEPLLHALAPDVIYAPSRVDFHPEHRRVAHACAISFATVATSGPIRLFEVQVPLGGLENLLCPVSAVSGQMRAAVRGYGSQRASLEWLERRLRYTARRHGRPGLLEAFWQLPAAAYLEMHRQPSQTWPQAFRGLRNHALTDPWAYLRGRSERHRLAVAVSAASKQGAISGSTNSAPAWER